MNEKDGTGRKSTDLVHSRYKELSGKALWWSEKDIQEVSQKGSVHQRDEKSKKKSVQDKLIG